MVAGGTSNCYTTVRPARCHFNFCFCWGLPLYCAHDPCSGWNFDDRKLLFQASIHGKWISKECCCLPSWQKKRLQASQWWAMTAKFGVSHFNFNVGRVLRRLNARHLAFDQNCHDVHRGRTSRKTRLSVFKVSATCETIKRFSAWESLLLSLHTTLCRTKILRLVTCLFCLNVSSHILGRLARIIQSRGSNLILMKYCEKYIHIPYACAGLVFPLGDH